MIERRAELRIQVWMIPILLSILTSIVVGAMTFQTFREKLVRGEIAESKNVEVRERVRTNTGIIEVLGNTVQETKEQLDKFVDRYNQNREDDQKLFREILRAVKA